MPNAYYPEFVDPPEEPIRVRLRSRPAGANLPKLLLFLAGFGALVAFALACAAILGALAYYQISNRILPGVKLGDQSMGGMSVEQAAILLDKNWNLDTRVLVTNGSQSQPLTPGQLGLQLDAKLTAQRALEFAHSGSLFGRAAQTLASLKDGWQVQPVLNLDAQIARSALEALIPLMSQPAKDARLQLEGTQLVAAPAELGYTINIEATLALMQSEPENILKQGVLHIIPKPVLPAVTDAAPLLDEAQRLLEQPASINVYDPITDERKSLPVPRDRLASWLQVQADDQGARVVLDQSGVASYLSSLEVQIGQDGYIDAERYSSPLAEALRQGDAFWVTISHRSTTYIVQPGDTMLKLGWKLRMPYWMILEANPGVNAEALLAGTELTIPSKDTLLPLPVIANKRILISLGKQRLYVYQDGKQIHQYVISTGIESSPTQPGVFQVQTHDPNAYASVWDLYMPDFLGIYEAWPGFMNGIHGLPTLSSGRRLWANVLGRPASYGCIILSLDEARQLYTWAEDGVVVEIRP